SRLLELGGGTGDDALFLAERGRNVVLTDGSPAMVARAAEKVRAAGWQHEIETRELALEQLAEVGRRWSGTPFDGAYSNFAALNCVASPAQVARGLASLLQPRASVLLVVFGRWAVGEILLQLVLGKPRVAFRRFARGDVPARLGGHNFFVRYPSVGDFRAAFLPWFRLARTRGIGVFVPPSAAEPTISSYPRLLAALETADRLTSVPLAVFGDHILMHFIRTSAPVANAEHHDG
ncbi:MAG: class I SAM-dependent methyltransferase, partial [Gemmatimonadetes bacterium]|nr:class I SAM-dependent methyltransferase [Gemmatimonadota bacterium]